MRLEVKADAAVAHGATGDVVRNGADFRRDFSTLTDPTVMIAELREADDNEAADMLMQLHREARYWRSEEKKTRDSLFNQTNRAAYLSERMKRLKKSGKDDPEPPAEDVAGQNGECMPGPGYVTIRWHILVHVGSKHLAAAHLVHQSGRQPMWTLADKEFSAAAMYRMGWRWVTNMVAPTPMQIEAALRGGDEAIAVASRRGGR
jgi:hypothetical protein